MGTLEFQFINSIYKKLNNKPIFIYIYIYIHIYITACHTLYATWKTRLKMISSHAIGLLIPMGEIEPPLLGFCRLLFSFPYIVFDSRIICKMITCNYFDSWKKDYNTHAIITRKFYVPGFHYPADFHVDKIDELRARVKD